MRILVAGGLLAAVGATATGAAAQDLDGLAGANIDMFDRGRNVSVQARPRPDFEAGGVRAGAFLVFPRLDLAVERNDNIYAAETGEVDDVIYHLKPEISAESQWNVHYLSGYARGSINRFADNESENTEEWALGGYGRLDVSRRVNLTAGGDYFDTFEPRSSPTAPATAVEPVQFTLAQAFAAVTTTSNRTRLSARADWRRYDYEDGVNGAGGVIDQDQRDRDAVGVTGRVDYAISPATAWFVQATANRRDYDQAGTPLSPVRDSDGVEALAGVSFELGAMTRGEIAAGYVHQQFDDASFEDVEGFGYRAGVEWFASPLTTVSVTAGRTVEDAVNPGVGGFLSTNLRLDIDHELLRNLIVSAGLTHGEDDYVGIDREDRRLGASIGATYLVNRRVGLNATASTTDTESAGADRDRDFRVNRLMVSLVTQF